MHLLMSLFPQDLTIRRRRLVRRWVAEGYSRGSQDGSAEQNGETIFSKLLRMNIIQQPAQVDTTAAGRTRMVVCQVNGFFHQYIVSRRLEENPFLQLEGRCTPSSQRKGRHLIIRESWDSDRIVFESINLSILRSMTVFGEWKSFFISRSMGLLRVLDLEDASGVKDDDLEKMVKLLRRLKFLSLRGCREVCHLPSSLDDLKQLQTLDVRNTSIVTLPDSIIELKKLQYIRAGGPIKKPSSPSFSACWFSKFCRCHDRDGVKVPWGIGKLTALHTLGVVNLGSFGGKIILRELGKLTQLHKLGVSGIIRNNTHKFFSAISGYGHLESLSVRLDKDNQGCLNGIPLLCENLHSLKVYGPVHRLPLIKDLSKLTKLCLEMTSLTEDDINLIGKLPKLRVLHISADSFHDELNFAAYGIEDPLPSYQNVKILKIASSSEIQVSFGSQAMKNLEVLTAHISSGAPVKFLGLGNLTQLNKVLLDSSDEASQEDLKSQLAKHPNIPVLQLEGEPPRRSQPLFI